MAKQFASREKLEAQVEVPRYLASEYAKLVERLPVGGSGHARIEAQGLLAEASELLARIDSAEVTYDEIESRNDHINRDLERLERMARR